MYINNRFLRSLAITTFSLPLLAGCSDEPLAPDGAGAAAVDQVADALDSKTEPEDVLLFGLVVSNEDDQLTIDILQPTAANSSTEILWSEVLPGRGVSGQPLSVTVDANTFIGFGTGTMEDVEAGTAVMVGGSLSEQHLIAHFILDPRELQHDPSTVQPIEPSGAWEVGPPLDVPAELQFKKLSGATSRISGSRQVHDFPGAYGGPSWVWNSPRLSVPVYWSPLLPPPLPPRVILRRVRPIVGFGGSQYNFPFSFEADGVPPLKVGESGIVQVTVHPEPPPESSLSFFFACGFDIQLEFEACFPFYPFSCREYTYDATLYSMVLTTDEPAPMPGEELLTEESACPEVELVKVPYIPVAILSLRICLDHTIEGTPFKAQVMGGPWVDFDGSPRLFPAVPNTNPLTVDVARFVYDPTLTIGLSLGLSVLTVPVYQTPTLLDLHSGPLHLIPTDDPACAFISLGTCGDQQVDNVSFEVPAIPVMTSFAASTSIARVGETINFEALVSGANGPGTSPKQVSFYDGAVQLATVPIDAQDTAVFAVELLYPGEHLITARYVGRDEANNEYPSERTVELVITGDMAFMRSRGYWQHQCRGNGETDFSAEELQAYLQIIDGMSFVFSEVRDISTPAGAFDVMFRAHNHGDALGRLDAALLVAWLNFASGSVLYDEMLDVDEDGGGDVSFADLVAGAEQIRLDPSASVREVKEQTRLLHVARKVATQAPTTDNVGSGL